MSKLERLYEELEMLENDHEIDQSTYLSTRAEILQEISEEKYAIIRDTEATDRFDENI